MLAYNENSQPAQFRSALIVMTIRYFVTPFA